ncbi:MAG: hypothetical protein M1819_005809 [Sarea resinae]|nr:MAG: hypothetical protein M1819_005809 [Sarea resinae]
MPGILPMKVIKVGTSSQARIAQACDRCRSKKIRCDGIRPCCSQCANVGFECKTSDKLSRRAFPRGYTESLEERVRTLEGEVRELKELLDEKDEKIDMLSRIHPHSSYTSQSSPRQRSDSKSLSPRQDEEPDDTFQVEVPALQNGSGAGATFMGASTVRAFVGEWIDAVFDYQCAKSIQDSFKLKAISSGKPCPNFSSESFFTADQTAKMPSQSTSDPLGCEAPPRLVSDQLINVFFQEWAPLFPVLHRPSFLLMFKDYVSNPESIKEKQCIAQLNLVFGIAALSCESKSHFDIDSFERQWQASLDASLTESTVATLQCLILALIYCILKGDHGKIVHYKGIAVGLSQRLGLHQSQERFGLGLVSTEIRKKVFWTLYTLDCFSSATLGLPKLLNETDVHTEYPADADDEYITEKGFQQSLPGEFTKMSGALALFRLSRVLSKVLDENYPSSGSYSLSLRKISALGDELDEWSEALPPHLKLQFVQDKPSTNVVSSRSLLLALAYYYIRSLIHRPVVISALGSKSSASVLTLAQSSKHIIQILQLLDERKFNFSICLNRNALLVSSGFGLLYQGVDLNQDGKLIKDSQRLVCSVIDLLERGSSPGAAAFKKVACSMIAVSRSSKSGSISRRNSDGSMPAPQSSPTTTHKRLQSIASRYAFSKHGQPKQDENGRRATLPTISTDDLRRNNSSVSISSACTEPVGTGNGQPAGLTIPHDSPNLDYLSFTSEAHPNHFHSVNKGGVSSSDWERLLGSIDNGQTNIYDNIYGGLPVDALTEVTPPSGAEGHGHPEWSHDTWGLDEAYHPSHPAHSVLSFSEESLTSGEELSTCDLGPGGSAEPDPYRGIMMPNIVSNEPFGMENKFVL